MDGNAPRDRSSTGGRPRRAGMVTDSDERLAQVLERMHAVQRARGGAWQMTHARLASPTLPVEEPVRDPRGDLPKPPHDPRRHITPRRKLSPIMTPREHFDPI